MTAAIRRESKRCRHKMNHVWSILTIASKPSYKLFAHPRNSTIGMHAIVLPVSLISSLCQTCQDNKFIYDCRPTLGTEKTLTCLVTVVIIRIIIAFLLIYFLATSTLF